MASPEIRLCAAPDCIALIAPTARQGTRFCSSACRQRAHRHRTVWERIDDRQWNADPCDYCAGPISPRRWPSSLTGTPRMVRHDTVYCSASCRQRSYRLRLAGRSLREELGITVKRRRSH